MFSRLFRCVIQPFRQGFSSQKGTGSVRSLSGVAFKQVKSSYKRYNSFDRSILFD
eukprot:m.39569 g.39569  ORF g.39569 m.39569 type:complete len:55 (+) comp32759_c0_seq3:43-207(+)